MKSFRYDFTMKELYYFLFTKKNCPKCGNNMKKSKEYEIVDGSMFKSMSTPLYIKGRKEVKYYYYSFNCYNCGSKYTLKELAQMKNNKNKFL